MQIHNIIIDENQKETTKHGSVEFPIAIYSTQINKNILGFIDWHWHEELQFCIVTKGTVSFNIEGDTVILSQGEGLFINSEQLHNAKNYKDIDSSYICFDFHPKLIYGFVGSVINIKYIRPYVGNSMIRYCILKNDSEWKSDILKDLLIIHKEYTEKNVGFELQILALLLRIWDSMAKNYLVSFYNDKLIHNTSRLKKIINFIHNHYMEKINLKDISDEVNLSKSACCREFKKYMNCSIFEYIINYRLVISENLLITTNESITNIAYQCGFGSASYFIEKFKLQTGVSPFIYRKKKQSISDNVL
ncbi:AraC family transcriptional regulator [Paraclostridium ghonii]|uniref:AraC-like DNA-binding protein/mannose-6-phosphate isomerase-like protein (Cupin superfamily) n=1 Tax=Paraclostridium ghonii TaxID=29358 RepID=A0ABU0MY53_9FIRM|nr:AraC family transcriptional regulator [Paeniclostridium ghonii]MDQ0555838.1 AraC-like DNA-binding protein/mannose-6-phosphate isomerase-like protein (cupin superfamily) [Paeniclostridium ghonii]